MANARIIHRSGVRQWTLVEMDGPLLPCGRGSALAGDPASIYFASGAPTLASTPAPGPRLDGQKVFQDVGGLRANTIPRLPQAAGPSIAAAGILWQPSTREAYVPLCGAIGGVSWHRPRLGGTSTPATTGIGWRHRAARANSAAAEPSSTGSAPRKMTG